MRVSKMRSQAHKIRGSGNQRSKAVHGGSQFASSRGDLGHRRRARSELLSPASVSSQCVQTMSKPKVDGKSFKFVRAQPLYSVYDAAGPHNGAHLPEIDGEPTWLNAATQFERYVGDPYDGRDVMKGRRKRQTDLSNAHRQTQLRALNHDSAKGVTAFLRTIEDDEDEAAFEENGDLPSGVRPELSLADA